MAAPRKYSLELRERAVRMHRTAGPKPQIKKLAVDLGVHPEALRGWIRQAEADASERDNRLTTDEHAELAALCKENTQLRRANEVLRTASALFAAHDPKRPRCRGSSTSTRTWESSASCGKALFAFLATCRTARFMKARGSSPSCGSTCPRSGCLMLSSVWAGYTRDSHQWFSTYS
ncbi:transposase [Streptomyces sp. NPDC087437]|uniref:transposase n=1 Tax=Streptomyces sp. NPDC087437 TaxID=3365789 RepID=UPI003804F0E4